MNQAGNASYLHMVDVSAAVWVRQRLTQRFIFGADLVLQCVEMSAATSGLQHHAPLTLAATSLIKGIAELTQSLSVLCQLPLICQSYAQLNLQMHSTCDQNLVLWSSQVRLHLFAGQLITCSNLQAIGYLANHVLFNRNMHTPPSRYCRCCVSGVI